MASTAPETARPFQIAPVDVFGGQWAPDNLMQAINPWNFIWQGDQVGLVNISLGQTKYPEVERAVLDEVGSYGKQLGHIGEALEVLIDHFDQADLSQKEKDALAIVKGELAEIREVKQRVLADKD